MDQLNETEVKPQAETETAPPVEAESAYPIEIVDGVPETTINLDLPRRIRLDFNALSDIESATGKTFFDSSITLGGSVRDIRHVLRSCLNAAAPDEDFTLEEVGAMIGFGGIKQVSEAIVTLIGSHKLIAHEDARSLAPYVPTLDEIIQAMLDDAGVQPGETLLDLGCGDGRIVFTAADRGLEATGVEIDEGRYKECVAKLRERDPETRVSDDEGWAASSNIAFNRAYIQDYLTQENLEGVDVVSLYLLTSSNAELKPLLRKLLKPGARVVSHDFSMAGWKARSERWVDVGPQLRRHGVYTYVIGAQPE